MAILPWIARALIGPNNVRIPVKKVFIYVEIIPCEIADIVSKHNPPHFVELSKSGRSVDDATGYESLHDAIVNAQVVSARCIPDIKPENLLFVFGQTIQSLQLSLREFADQHLVSYPMEDCFGPIYNEQDAGENQEYGDPLAIVLCKIVKAERLEPVLGTENQKGRDSAKRYEITWGEFEELQKRLKVTVAHDGRLR